MERLSALLIALVFAVSSAGLPTAWAQAKKEAPPATTQIKPAKPEAAKKKAPLDLNTASADELKTGSRQKAFET